MKNEMTDFEKKIYNDLVRLGYGFTPIQIKDISEIIKREIKRFGDGIPLYTNCNNIYIDRLYKDRGITNE